MIANRTELAEIVGVHPTVIDRYRRLGMPVGKKGGAGRGYQFDVAACVQWIVNHLANKAPGEDPYERARAEKTVADARLRQMRLEELEGQMITRELAEEGFARVKAILTSEIEAFAPRAVQRVLGISDAAEIERILTDEVKRTLTAIADTEIATE